MLAALVDSQFCCGFELTIVCLWPLHCHVPPSDISRPYNGSCPSAVSSNSFLHRGSLNKIIRSWWLLTFCNLCNKSLSYSSYRALKHFGLTGRGFGLKQEWMHTDGQPFWKLAVFSADFDIVWMLQKQAFSPSCGHSAFLLLPSTMLQSEIKTWAD